MPGGPMLCRAKRSPRIETDETHRGQSRILRFPKLGEAFFIFGPRDQLHPPGTIGTTRMFREPQVFIKHRIRLDFRFGSVTIRQWPVGHLPAKTDPPAGSG